MNNLLGYHDTVEELGSLVPRSTARSQGLNRAVDASSAISTTFENGCKRAGGVETCVTTERHAITNQFVKIRNSDSTGRRKQKTALSDFGVLRFRNMQFAITQRNRPANADEDKRLKTSGERDAPAPGCGAQLPNEIGFHSPPWFGRPFPCVKGTYLRLDFKKVLLLP